MNSLKELAAFFDQQTYPVLYKNFLVEASFKEAEFVKQYIKANNRVLDLHCGEGRHIDLLSSSNIYLEALDAQKHFIENIKSRQPNIITGYMDTFLLSCLLDRTYNFPPLSKGIIKRSEKL